jgi:hypothetical protein
VPWSIYLIRRKSPTTPLRDASCHREAGGHVGAAGRAGTEELLEPENPNERIHGCYYWTERPFRGTSKHEDIAYASEIASF